MSTTPSFFDEPRLVRLGKLLGEIKDGQIHVARFQRPFVWTDKQRLDLLQSIYLGYPIGSILVWRTQDWRLKTYENLGPVRLPEQSTDHQTVRQYLIDGHQRMTTLFASLGPGLYDADATSSSLVIEDDGIRWPIFFDLLDDGNQPFRLLRRRQERAPSTWLRLDILLDSFSLGEFKDALRNEGQPRELVNRVQAIADILRDYTIPVIPMATEDLEQVTTSFKRVNSGGTRMSEVHMVNALTWTETFDLLERIDDLKPELDAEGWGSFEPQMLLNVCKAHFELDIYKASAEELANSLRNEPQTLDSAKDAIIRVAQVLREIGIHGPESLPHSYQAVLLADALRFVPSIHEVTQRRIREWIWLTTLTEYFQSMTGSLFRRAQEHLRQLVKKDKGELELKGKGLASPPDQPTTIDPLMKFDFRSARSRAIALLMAEQSPMSPHSGTELPAHALLAEHGNDALVPLMMSTKLPKAYRKLAQGPENRFLVPPREGALLRDAFLDHPDRAKLAKSHVIPKEAFEALERDDAVHFLEVRRAALWDLERQRAEELGLVYRDELLYEDLYP